MNISDDDLVIAIIGLGYVGLPLAVEFGKIHRTLGFDISQPRIEELRAGHDRTLEVEAEQLKQASRLSFTTQVDDMHACNFFIVTVPTPIDEHNQSDGRSGTKTRRYRSVRIHCLSGRDRRGLRADTRATVWPSVQSGLPCWL